MPKARALLKITIQYFLAVTFVLMGSLIILEYFFAPPPGNRKFGFPVPYRWYTSLPPLFPPGQTPPGYIEPRSSGWIVEGILIDFVFYALISALILILLRIAMAHHSNQKNARI